MTVYYETVLEKVGVMKRDVLWLLVVGGVWNVFMGTMVINRRVQ